MKPTRRVKTIYVAALSLVLLCCGFYTNQWHVAEQGLFEAHQRDVECLLIGRLVKSRQDGIFSGGGLLGLGSKNTIAPKLDAGRATIDFQYGAYIHNLRFQSFFTYKSQIGGLGILFSMLDSLITPPPQTKLDLFRLGDSFLTASVLTLIICWFYYECGLLAALTLLVSMVFSPWLVVFGRNLFWCIWAFYLPMLALQYVLGSSKSAAGNRDRSMNRTFAWTVLFVVFLKCATGYEFITTMLLMTMVPLVYYSIRDQWSLSLRIKRVVMFAASSFAAVCISIGILFYQIYCVTGNMTSGMKHMFFSLLKRTYRVPSSIRFDAAITQSFESDPVAVVSGYLTGTFLDLNTWGHSLGLWPKTSYSFLTVSYLDLIICFFIASVYLLGARCFMIDDSQKRKIAALLAATWFSILAPLSWLLIFKAHSFIHMHTNFIVWHMPFVLFGFAVCGCAAEMLLTDFLTACKNIRANNKRGGHSCA